MTRWLSGLFAGALFGVGLALGGMTRPSKVLAFLDFSGDWDPSLAFVMGGAIAVFAPAYRWIMRHAKPVYAARFFEAPLRGIQPRLVVGSAVFGVGWGLAGFCPGPGIVSAGSGAAPGLVFLAAMLLGMLLYTAYERTQSAGAPTQSTGAGGALPNAVAPKNDAAAER